MNDSGDEGNAAGQEVNKLKQGGRVERAEVIVFCGVWSWLSGVAMATQG